MTAQTQVALTKEEIAEREKLEEELTALATSKNKLEAIMADLSSENLKLREVVGDKEDEKSQQERTIDNLRKANILLQQQQEEERKILEEKTRTVIYLQSQLDEQHLNSFNRPHSAPTDTNLHMELMQLNLNPSGGSKDEIPTRDRDEDEEDLIKQQAWQASLNSMEKKEEELKQKEQKLAGTELEPGDKEWMLTELKKFRKAKGDEHALLSLVCGLRERLYDAEIKNLSRTMRNVTVFADLVQYSHCVIDSVIKEVQRKILTKEVGDNDMVKLVGELLLENCKLRKIANDYAEAINQGTIEKLEKFKKVWPAHGRMEGTAGNNNSKKPTIWDKFPLFDFFTGWTSVDNATPNPQK